MDYGKTLLKGGKALLLSAVSVGAAALVGWLADPVAVTAALEEMPAAWVAVIVPVVNGLAEMVRTALKHRRRSVLGEMVRIALNRGSR
jgi:hypothetical protein